MVDFSNEGEGCMDRSYCWWIVHGPFLVLLFVILMFSFLGRSSVRSIVGKDCLLFCRLPLRSVNSFFCSTEALKCREISLCQVLALFPGVLFRKFLCVPIFLGTLTTLSCSSFRVSGTPLRSLVLLELVFIQDER